MSVTKEKKRTILETLKSILKSKAITFVNFHGLSVAEATELRRNLKKAGVSYTVAKKTLAKKALKESAVEGSIPELSGELAIAYGEDSIVPAREVFSFQKKFDGRISILGGVFEGKFIGPEEAKALALIPPLDTLRAQFVNLINSPIQGFVMALDAIAQAKVK